MRGAALPDYLPWLALLAPQVCLTTGGGLMTTWRVRGPDLESYTEPMIAAYTAQLNHLWMRYGTGWALHWDAHRDEVATYPASDWPTEASRLIDAERAALFLDAGVHYTTTVYLTLTMQAPMDQVQHLWDWAYEHIETEGASTATPLDAFAQEVQALEGLLRSLFAAVQRLTNDELCTYLHACCSTKRHPVLTPRVPLFLSQMLADQPLTGGEEPRLGDDHLRVISIKAWPHGLWPGILGPLEDLGMPMRTAVRWLPLDKAQSARECHRAQRHFLQKQKRLLAIAMEQFTGKPTRMVEPEANEGAQNAIAAQAAVTANLISLGYLTWHVLVWDPDYQRVRDKATLVQNTLNAEGFVTTLERQHSVEAWLATMPGNLYDHIARSPLLSSTNLVDMAPISSPWTGVTWNIHLNGPPVCMATTGSSTPFGLSLHEGDVGNALVIGPTGTGKDVILWFLASQFQRYKDAQVFIVDKGHGSRAMTLAQGGTYEALAGAMAQPGQPLAAIDDETECLWAAEWVADLVRLAEVPLTPLMQRRIWEALITLAAMPPDQRTLTALVVLLQDPVLRDILRSYTLEGPYGVFLDGDQDATLHRTWHALAMDTVLTMPTLLPALLSYRFHRLEAQLEGQPTLILLNEFGEYLAHPLIIHRVRQWLTQLRKRNASVVLASQSIAHLTHPLLLHAGQDIPTRIFLPNRRAQEAGTGELYTAWGVNSRQQELIATGIPKQQYYVMQKAGTRMIDFQHGPRALALCGAGSQEDLDHMDTMTARPGEAWVEAWLQYKGVTP